MIRRTLKVLAVVLGIPILPWLVGCFMAKNLPGWLLWHKGDNLASMPIYEFFHTRILIGQWVMGIIPTLLLIAICFTTYILIVCTKNYVVYSRFDAPTSLSITERPKKN